MKSTRFRSQVVLLAYLFLIFTLGCLHLPAGSYLSFSALLYVTVALAVLEIIIASNWKKFPLVFDSLAWLLVYLLARILFPSTAASEADASIYNVISEEIVLLVAVALAYHTAEELNKLEDLVKKAANSSLLDQIRDFQTAMEDIKKEIVRGRRYNHPLSLLVVETAQDSANNEAVRAPHKGQKRGSHQSINERFAEIIVRQVRRTDMVLTRNWDGRFFILCPENTASGTRILAQRLQSDVRNSLDMSLNYGIAAFPADALTLEDLIRRAETNMIVAAPSCDAAAEENGIPAVAIDPESAKETISAR